MENSFENIPAEKFEFADRSDISHDKKFETKPVGYFQDAFRRFCKNKGSIVGAVIIIMLILFAIFVPFFTQYTVDYSDTYYRYTLPKSKLFANTTFWDGCEEKTLNKQTFDYYYLMGEETGHPSVKNNEYTINGNLYTFRLDSYHPTGCVY